MQYPEIIKNASLLTACYLIGSIPFCNLIAHAVGKKDLRKIGDKNPGGWNLVFNVSRYWGIAGIFLDMAKGFFSYFLLLAITNSVLIAILGGCIAVAGHNYSIYYKFSGGKGIATAGGFLLAANPWNIIPFAFGFLTALFLIKNMIWGVIFALVFPILFMAFFLDSPVYFTAALLLIIIIPKYINHDKSLTENFRFRKEKSMKDLFTPKIR